MSSRKGEEHLESKIIIRSYPQDTTEKDLRIMFEKYGNIEDLFSPKDRETRKPRGFTFCQYRSKEDAEDAIKGLDKRDMGDCKLSVEFCRIPRPENRGGGGRGDRDRSRERYGRDRRRSRSPRDRSWRSSPPRDRGRERDKFRDDPYRHNGRGGGYEPYGPPAVPEQYGVPPRGFGGSRGVPPEVGMGGSVTMGPSGRGGMMGAPPGSRPPRGGLLEPPYPLLPSASGPPPGGAPGGPFSAPPPPGRGPPEGYGSGMRDSYGGPPPPGGAVA